MNHFSDIVNLNNSIPPHNILKDAISKLNRAWGKADKFTTGQQIYLLKLFCHDQNIASIYASTENSRIRRGYALTELEQYQEVIKAIDMDDRDAMDEDK